MADAALAAAVYVEGLIDAEGEAYPPMTDFEAGAVMTALVTIMLAAAEALGRRRTPATAAV